MLIVITINVTALHPLHESHCIFLHCRYIMAQWLQFSAVEIKPLQSWHPFCLSASLSLTCPKYGRLPEVIPVETAAIVQDVSFVHSYGTGCIFLEDSGIRSVERENAQVAGRLLFRHDLNNEFYLLNCFSFFL